MIPTLLTLLLLSPPTLEGARALEDAGQLEPALEAYQRGAKRCRDASKPRCLELLLGAGRVHERLGDEAKARRALQRVVQSYQRLDDAGRAVEGCRAAAGRARLLLVEIERPSLTLIKLEAHPVAALRRSLKQKIEALRRLEKGWLEVIQIGHPPSSVEAISALGRAYIETAEGLRGLPPPASLSTSEMKDAYKEQLHAATEPFWQKGRAIIEKGIEICEQKKLTLQRCATLRDDWARLKAPGRPSAGGR